MKVEVVYALPDEQVIFKIESQNTTMTVEDVIKESGLLDKYPQIDLTQSKIGIYGQIVELNHSVTDKDRIEIYRELTIDPKQARMLRAEQKRKKEGLRGFGA
ncbi:RnfH family protein [Francisella sp. Scap27]|uniref:RnfH family protein n=1 Tax=Francisella sp. Scap27 TaxID=2589986 RepID=UPI0015C1245A|nr:RnfH family protein [Francisella sp. Scap27]QLE78592.1 RnfH family protein [Francisella sp. Scap27]